MVARGIPNITKGKKNKLERWKGIISQKNRYKKRVKRLLGILMRLNDVFETERRGQGGFVLCRKQAAGQRKKGSNDGIWINDPDPNLVS